jgi:hypothetical protein
MKTLISIYLLTTVTITTLAATLPSPQELFKRHFDAVGGKHSITNIETISIDGLMLRDGVTNRFALRLKLPARFLLTIGNGKGPEIIQGRDDRARAWEKDETGVHDLTNSVSLATLVIGLFPPAQVFLDERLEDAVTETDTAEGRPVFAIGRKNIPNRSFPRLLFDSKTGLLLRAGQTRFSDYSTIGTNGIKLPCTLQQGAGSIFLVKQIEINQELAESLFERPGKRGGWLSNVTPGIMPTSFKTETLLSQPGKLQIVNHPATASKREYRLRSMPHHDPASGAHGQVALQGADLRGLNLSSNLLDLLHADFDTHTLWPAKIPTGFDPSHVMELGKNPGLGLRQLHRQGITGVGVGVATIDFQLLTDHQEYADRLRLYEAMESPAGLPAHMHGTAVASIAVGKTCGVAPGADLYHIASQNMRLNKQGKLDLDFTPIAKSINRLLDLNAQLPAQRKIRVISLSMGWSPGTAGYEETMAAVDRANHERVFVLSTALRHTHQVRFDGLNREAMDDPEVFESYAPGSWWASMFWNGEMRFKPGKRLCVPMDARTTASPTGANEYVHYSYAGWSWSVPWLAGLYALACQVCPEVTPELFWQEALKTGRTIQLNHNGETMEFGTIADPVRLIEALRARNSPSPISLNSGS